jgi:alkylation response protein AidB-like acyl-CoA dehydrogenase
MQNLAGIGFSEGQSDLLDVASNFCREKSPIAKVRILIEEELGFDAAVWREIGALGWLAIAVPEPYGGVGLGLAEVVPVVEQMGRRMLATPFVSTHLAVQALLHGGTEAQKTEFLGAVCAGQAATIALTEASGHWDLQQCQASAQRADGQLQLSGCKLLVCDAVAASFILVSVVYEGRAALVIVRQADIPAGALRRETILDETKRSYALTLDSISVPIGHLLDPDRTAATLQQVQLAANLLIAAENCGSAQSVIDYTIDYLNTRRQFGQLIGAYQAVKHPTVAAYVGYEKARSHLYSAAFSFHAQGEGEMATRMAAVQAERALAFAADRSIQFHGGFGFTYDCDAQLYRRRGIFNAALFGDEGWHKKILAGLLL